MTSLSDARRLARKSWIVLLAAIAGGVGAWGLSRAATPTYTATTQVFVYLTAGDTAADLYNGSSFTQNQIASYAQIAAAPVVLDPVIAQLRLPTTSDRLSSAVDVTNPPDTTILSINATASSPAGAAALANAVGQQFEKVISEVAPTTSTGTTTVKARTIAPATPPTAATTPKTGLNVALGVLIGILASALGLYVWSRIDTRIRDRSDLLRMGGAAVLTSVPRSDFTGIVLTAAPNSVDAEAYRQLVVDLQYVAVDSGAMSVVVTSSLEGEGKTTTACNLAIAWSEAGARVLLIDADLHRPMVARRMGLEEHVGLSTVLAGRARLSEVTRLWGDGALSVLPAGGVPPNPGELIASTKMSSLLQTVVARYDVVILDSPPGGVVAAASALARRCTGALIVADSTQIREDQLHRTIDALTGAGAQILGVTLNKTRPISANYIYTPRTPSPDVRSMPGDPTRVDA